MATRVQHTPPDRTSSGRSFTRCIPYVILFDYCYITARRESGPPAGWCKIKHDLRNRIVTPLTGYTTGHDKETFSWYFKEETFSWIDGPARQYGQRLGGDGSDCAACLCAIAATILQRASHFDARLHSGVHAACACVRSLMYNRLCPPAAA